MELNELAVQDLLEQSRSGSTEASQRLWELYSIVVRRAVRRRLPRQLRTIFDSEDFTQQVWASFFQGQCRMPEIDTPAQLVAYLQQMAHNKVVDECRRRLGGVLRNESRRQILSSSMFANLQPKKEHATPSEVAMNRELLEQIHTKLPDVHRRIVEMRSNGLTYLEIASATGMHEGSVRRIMSNLYRHLVD